MSIVYLLLQQQKKNLRQRYNSVGATERADKCVECGKCESHCPQAIKIREELKNVTALFA